MIVMRIAITPSLNASSLVWDTVYPGRLGDGAWAAKERPLAWLLSGRVCSVALGKATGQVGILPSGRRPSKSTARASPRWATAWARWFLKGSAARIAAWRAMSVVSARGGPVGRSSTRGCQGRGAFPAPGPAGLQVARPYERPAPAVPPAHRHGAPGRGG